MVERYDALVLSEYPVAIDDEYRMVTSELERAVERGGTAVGHEQQIVPVHAESADFDWINRAARSASFSSMMTAILISDVETS